MGCMTWQRRASYAQAAGTSALSLSLKTIYPTISFHVLECRHLHNFVHFLASQLFSNKSAYRKYCTSKILEEELFAFGVFVQASHIPPIYIPKSKLH